MQNIIWSILLLAFMIDVFRRSLLNNEKNITEKAENNNSNKDLIIQDNQNQLSKNSKI